MKKEDIDRYMKFLPAYRPYRDLYVFFDEEDYKREYCRLWNWKSL